MTHPCQAVSGQTECDPTKFCIKPESGLSAELSVLSLTGSRSLMVLLIRQGAPAKLKQRFIWHVGLLSSGPRSGLRCDPC